MNSQRSKHRTALRLLIIMAIALALASCATQPTRFFLGVASRLSHCIQFYREPDSEIKLFSCEWFHVYDVIERIFKELKNIDSGPFAKSERLDL